MSNNILLDTINVLRTNGLSYNETISKISATLSIAKGTINRWISNNKIPKSYQFDLMKLQGCPINYSQFTASEKDQFYTPPNIATECCTILYNILTELGEDKDAYTYIEPSAGSGSFLKSLPSSNTIAMDIEPMPTDTKINIETQDFLSWSPTISNHPDRLRHNKYIVVGNPPFGLRGNLALRFINHSYPFADFVAFILPQLFESDGKGSPRKRVKGYNLIYSKKLFSDIFVNPSGKEIVVNTIFQIWSKHYETDEYKMVEVENPYFRVYSLSDGGTPSSTRNKKMIGLCDFYLPSTCFGKENIHSYNSFEELPNNRGYGIVFKDKKYYTQICKNIKWEDIAFKSTNSAYNLRTSQITKSILQTI
jgi:hypothetical protein